MNGAKENHRVDPDADKPYHCFHKHITWRDPMGRAVERDCHCIALRRAAALVTTHYDRALAACGIGISQFSLLHSLQRLGVSNVSRLAEQVGLERSTLTRNLKPLFEAGYIEDYAEAGNRDRQIAVSESGAVLLDEAIPLWESAQKDVKNAVGGKNLKELARLLERLEELRRPRTADMDEA